MKVMIMKIQKLILAAIAAVTLMTAAPFAPAIAGDKKHDMVMVEDAWARARGAKAKVAGAFMTVHNGTKTDDRIIEAKSPIAKRVELHTHQMKDGVMKMIHVKEGIPVPAGQMTAMKPGGYHVMFMGLNQPLEEGQMFPLTLVLEKAGEVKTMVHVKSAGAMGGHNHKHMKKHSN